MDIKSKLSLLWIFVMINMLMADIVGFMTPGALKAIVDGQTDFQITQELLLLFSVLLEIPIIMIILSKFLEYKINRILNIIASIITILFVVGMGSQSLSYIFFASIEVVAMLVIIWTAWKWKEVYKNSPKRL